MQLLLLKKKTLKSTLYLLPKFSRVPLTIVLVLLKSTTVNSTLLNFAKRYKDGLRVIAKVALRFGCAKQSNNLKRYLIYIPPISYMFLFSGDPKGQIISEENFGVSNFPKYQPKNLTNFCPST